MKKPKLYRSTAERQSVRRSQSNARRDRAGVTDIKRLRDTARRFERRVGLTGGKRMLSDKQIKKLTKEERQAVAKEYERRLARAENLAKQGVKVTRIKAPASPSGIRTAPSPTPASTGGSAPPPPPPPSPEPEPEPEDFVEPWEEYEAWDKFKKWLGEMGIFLDPNSEFYWTMRDYSIQLGAEGQLHANEMFEALCERYMSLQDVEDL